MKELLQGKIDQAALTYDVKLEDGKVKVSLEIDLAADAQKLEAAISSPIVKALIEIALQAMKAV